METEKDTKPIALITPEEVKSEDRIKYMVDELKLRIETYRSYINLTLQINGFFYLTTGAALGFYLKAPDTWPDHSNLEYFLWLPILIGTVLGGIFIHGAELQKSAAKNIETIREQLNKYPQLDIKEIPDLKLLRPLLLIFGTIFFIAGVALIIVPLMRTFSSFKDVILHPEKLTLFTWGGLLILVGGGALTYIFLHMCNRNTPEVRRGSKGTPSETEEHKANDNSTAA